MRTIGGIIAGIVLGVAAMMIVTFVGGIFFPVQGEVDLNDPESIRSMFAASPLAAKIIILLSWFTAALVGGAVAKRIGRRAWTVWAVAGLFVLMALTNVLVLPMPVWMQIVALIAPLLGGWLAGHIGPREVKVEEEDGTVAHEEV